MNDGDLKLELWWCWLERTFMRKEFRMNWFDNDDWWVVKICWIGNWMILIWNWMLCFLDANVDVIECELWCEWIEWEQLMSVFKYDEERSECCDWPLHYES